MQPILGMPAGGVRWLIPILALSSAFELVVVATVVLSLDDGTLVGLIVGAAGLPAIFVVGFVIPVRYEVWSSKLSIVFLFGRRWDLPFYTIEAVEAAKGMEAYAYTGVRFAMSPSQAIVVKRKGANKIQRPNIVISPENREPFLETLQRAIATNPEAG
jgi:hypothetical protein